MRLRWKIFFVALFAAIAVGATTASLFARSWKNIAAAYGLSTLQAQLDRPDLDGSFEGWELESRGDDHRWKSAVPRYALGHEKELATELIQTVAKTRLQEGCFEYSSQVVPGHRFFLAFRALSNQGGLRILGLESTSLLAKLKPWALPFAGILLLVIFIVAGVSYAVSSALDSDYELIQRSLENIGAGRLKDLPLPKSNDPSIKLLSEGLVNLTRVLDEKDNQISQVSSLAFQDPMTGIPNYRAFERFTNKILAEPIAQGTQRALVIVDVDFFKKVNDGYGHPVGDFVLKEVAKMLRACVAPEGAPANATPDFFARYGGEEFVIVMPNIDPSLAQTIPLKILHMMKSTRLHVPAGITESGQSVVISITASFGLAIWEEGWTREQWVKEADQGLYHAKEHGRARVVRLRPEVKEWT